MKAISVRREGCSPETLIGRRLCHDLADSEGKFLFRKGHPVQEADLPLLFAAPWESLHLVQLEAGELDEIAAGARLGQTLSGRGVSVEAGAHGKQTLRAAHKGLLKIDTAALQGINALPGIAVYTLLNHQIVSAGEVIAYAQITPLALPVETIEAVERRVYPAGHLLSVLPFFPRTVVALCAEQNDPAVQERFVATLTQKLEWFGSSLRQTVPLPPNPEAIRASLADAIASKATLILITGSNALDPLDPFLVALAAAGGRLDRIGLPTHPGTLLWLARCNDIPLIGLPRCGLFSRSTAFDLLLPQILARGKIDPEEIAALGHGGILNRDMTFRFPSYDKKEVP